VNKVKVFVADDHFVVREGVKRLIEAEADMEVIGEAADGMEAVEKASDCKPDVILVDLSMPNLSGVETAHQLKQKCPNIAVIALTVHEDKGYLRELLEAGASGYVLKRAAGNELILAIRAVSTGGVYVDPHMTTKLISTLVPPAGRSVPGSGELSERESAVLKSIAQGYSNKEIAAQLGVSVKTVETYKARSMEKLDLKSRVDIIRTATERGWLRP
jgi:two-component system, NarL family, response regulator NreC